MIYKYSQVSSKVPHFLYGGDYNPDQWLAMPGIIEDDYRQMQKAHCNAMTLAVFSWSILEPEEGVFNFSWLDASMDNLYKNGIYTILATPTGARPAWLARKYPEVLRTNDERMQYFFGSRHNHCYTSPVFREKAGIINRELALRYKDHPGLILWHISNEFSGECHCALCQAAFRSWLKEQYRHDLDALNAAWYTSFWSQRYSDWEEIASPSRELGQPHVHGLNLDWKRFVTHQTVDYMKHEIRILKEYTPAIPVTTNLMGTYPGLNYWVLAPELDVISWDNYPLWHMYGYPGGNTRIAAETAFKHDLNRSLKGGRPFLLMESTPSSMTWVPVSKPKKPGMNLLASLQAVAHGSDSVQYFQWRQARGNCEKFHGAVMDHSNSENTRVFEEAAETGAVLRKLDAVLGTTRPAQVALIYDWENRWAIEDTMGPRNDPHREYEKTCIDHYYPFWKKGIPVDIINMDCDFTPYKLLIAPMLYMVRKGTGERITAFIAQGGIFITTYFSGLVDEHDLCFLSGFPGPLRKVLGIWSEEMDPLYPGEENAFIMTGGNELGLTGEYKAVHYCDLVHAEGAAVLAEYKSDFYTGRPALTVNHYGSGRAYYMAARSDDRFLHDFYLSLIKQIAPEPAMETEFPAGVTAHKRTDGDKDYIFIMNFEGMPADIELGDKQYTNMVTGAAVSGRIRVAGFGVIVLSCRIGKKG